MTKTLLLAGVAAMSLAATPALAQIVDAEVNYENNIATSLENNSWYESNLAIEGDVDVHGTIHIDESATAISDLKQVIEENAVILGDDDEEDELEESTVANTSAGFDVDVDGNAGVNVASGYYNAQANVSTIAVATAGDDDSDDPFDDGELEDGGLAKANTTSLQVLTGTLYGEADVPGDADDLTMDENTARVSDVSGDGNIGVNSAAGAFNIQSNVMTLAVANNAALADASAGVVQNITGNLVLVSDTANTAGLGSVTGAGNLAVNVAAGVGNMQHNSLTVAASGEFGANATGGVGAGG